VIGDLMTGKNPTVGLAAHAGQTDVRITAKAATAAEAEALIAPVEAELRQRLGVAIYGLGKETVAEVVGRLLAEQGLKLAVIDTLTRGQLGRELAEAGFEQLIASDLHPVSLAEAGQSLGLNNPLEGGSVDGRSIAAQLAQAVAPEHGLGLALAGPFADKSTFIAVHGPGEMRLVELGRIYRREEDYVRRWLVIQGLDWVRRALLGQLTSPVDWR
jgi:nicotinamide-nucleotide amidase